MTIRTFILGSAITGVIAGIIWVLIVLFLDPDQAGWVGYLLFFLSLFLTIASVCSLLGFAIRRVVSAQRLSAYSVRVALRQGIMLGIFLDILLLLVRLHLYRWWVALILTILFVFTELLFLSYDRASTRRSTSS